MKLKNKKVFSKRKKQENNSKHEILKRSGIFLGLFAMVLMAMVILYKSDSREGLQTSINCSHYRDQKCEWRIESDGKSKCYYCKYKPSDVQRCGYAPTNGTNYFGGGDEGSDMGGPPSSDTPSDFDDGTIDPNNPNQSQTDPNDTVDQDAIDAIESGALNPGNGGGNSGGGNAGGSGDGGGTTGGGGAGGPGGDR